MYGMEGWARVKSKIVLFIIIIIIIMVEYMLEQHIFLYDSYVKYSARRYQRKLCQFAGVRILLLTCAQLSFPYDRYNWTDSTAVA